MATVHIFDYRTGTQHTLDKDQTRFFQRELTRVKKGQAATKGPREIAPDCRISVKSGSKVTTYLLLSRAVLMQARTRKAWQFYMGLLILEWLHPTP